MKDVHILSIFKMQVVGTKSTMESFTLLCVSGVFERFSFFSKYGTLKQKIKGVYMRFAHKFTLNPS